MTSNDGENYYIRIVTVWTVLKVVILKLLI